MAYAQVIRLDESIAEIISFPLAAFNPKELCEIADKSSGGQWNYINVQKANKTPPDYIITRDENGEIFIRELKQNLNGLRDVADKIVDEWMKP